MSAANNPTRNEPEARPATAHVKIIRDAEFAKRLDQACDTHPMIPAKNAGRQVWFKRELMRRFDISVSTETVRKWFSGEAKPREAKAVKIAELLGVDPAWLTLGVNGGLAPRERKVLNAMADGAVNLVAGLIQMDGGHPALPSEGDVDVDLHAIIRGAKYDLRVVLGEHRGQNIHFAVPINSENLVVLGVVKRGFNIEIFEITLEQLVAGERRAGFVELEASPNSFRRIESFANRL